MTEQKFLGDVEWLGEGMSDTVPEFKGAGREDIPSMPHIRTPARASTLQPHIPGRRQHYELKPPMMIGPGMRFDAKFDCPTNCSYKFGPNGANPNWLHLLQCMADCAAARTAHVPQGAGPVQAAGVGEGIVAEGEGESFSLPSRRAAAHVPQGVGPSQAVQPSGSPYGPRVPTTHFPSREETRPRRGSGPEQAVQPSVAKPYGLSFVVNKTHVYPLPERFQTAQQAEAAKAQQLHDLAPLLKQSYVLYPESQGGGSTAWKKLPLLPGMTLELCVRRYSTGPESGPQGNASCTQIYPVVVPSMVPISGVGEGWEKIPTYYTSRSAHVPHGVGPSQAVQPNDKQHSLPPGPILLKWGDKEHPNAEVKSAQALLNKALAALGYYGIAVDGVIGPATCGAIALVESKQQQGKFGGGTMQMIKDVCQGYTMPTKKTGGRVSGIEEEESDMSKFLGEVEWLGFPHASAYDDVTQGGPLNPTARFDYVNPRVPHGVGPSQAVPSAASQVAPYRVQVVIGSRFLVIDESIGSQTPVTALKTARGYWDKVFTYHNPGSSMNKPTTPIAEAKKGAKVTVMLINTATGQKQDTGFVLKGTQTNAQTGRGVIPHRVSNISGAEDGMQRLVDFLGSMPPEAAGKPGTEAKRFLGDVEWLGVAWKDKAHKDQEVMAVQSWLNSLLDACGYHGIDVDGVLGPGTCGALAMMGDLKNKGCASDALWAKAPPGVYTIPPVCQGWTMPTKKGQTQPDKPTSELAKEQYALKWDTSDPAAAQVQGDINKALDAIDYNPIPVSGKLDAQTCGALRLLQKKTGVNWLDAYGLNCQSYIDPTPKVQPKQQPPPVVPQCSDTNPCPTGQKCENGNCVPIPQTSGGGGSSGSGLGLFVLGASVIGLGLLATRGQMSSAYGEGQRSKRLQENARRRRRRY
jgi:lysozyme family protein